MYLLKIVIFFNWRQLVVSMTTPDDRVRVASRISKDLDVRVRQFYVTSSSAIPEALELLASNKEGIDDNNDATKETYDATQTSQHVAAMQGRIDDLLTSVEFLRQESISKNTQIEQQAYHIQSLIQENSRLNIKLLPENTGERVKPWWRFW
jgi:TolA-binding protein